MTFAAWKAAFATTARTSPERQAQLWNLDHESRINKERGYFKKRLGRLFREELAARRSPSEAAEEALKTAIRSIKKVDCRWLGLLQVPPGAGLPESMATHLTATDLMRYVRPRGYIDPLDPPTTARFEKAYKMMSDTPEVRFIWLTFEGVGAPLPDDPTVVVRLLGLAHFKPGNYVYRLDLDVTDLQLFIPTCLDASLYWAWAPPPTGHAHPWGLTRDVTSGTLSRPELLTQTVDHAARRPQAKLVSPPGARQPIGNYAVDFMANR